MVNQPVAILARDDQGQWWLTVIAGDRHYSSHITERNVLRLHDDSATVCPGTDACACVEAHMHNCQCG